MWQKAKTEHVAVSNVLLIILKPDPQTSS